MIDRLPILALLVLASLPANPAHGAAPATRTYSVTSFDRIRIDGPYKVALKTNVSPFARATGSPLALDGLSIGVEGRTLVVRTGSGGWGGYSGEDRGRRSGRRPTRPHGSTDRGMSVDRVGPPASTSMGLGHGRLDGRCRPAKTISGRAPSCRTRGPAHRYDRGTSS